MLCFDYAFQQLMYLILGRSCTKSVLLEFPYRPVTLHRELMLLLYVDSNKNIPCPKLPCKWNKLAECLEDLCIIPPDRLFGMESLTFRDTQGEVLCMSTSSLFLKCLVIFYADQASYVLLYIYRSSGNVYGLYQRCG